MAVKAKYTDPIQVPATPEMKRELVELAELDEVSMAHVIRECIALGLPHYRQRRGDSRA